MTIECWSCGAAVSDGATCPECGTPWPTIVSQDAQLTASRMPEHEQTVNDLTTLYHAAVQRAGLPYRSPSHRLASQLVATGEAHAYATALAALTGDDAWKARAREMNGQLRGRERMAQQDIDSAEQAESRLRRYGLHGLLP